MREINELADFHYIRQRDPLGLGHAVCGRVGARRTGVVRGAARRRHHGRRRHAAARMLDVHDRGTAVRCSRCSRCRSRRSRAYGCVAVEPVADGLVRVQQIVEKPQPEEALSNLAVIGRYVFTPGIFDVLDRHHSPASVASSSSPTPSGCCSTASRCTAWCSRRAATTSAASSTSCAPTSSSASSAMTCVSRSSS